MKVRKSLLNRFKVMPICFILLILSACSKSTVEEPTDNTESLNTTSDKPSNIEEITTVMDELSEYENSVMKKGVASSRYNSGSSAHLAKLEELNISWYYNWGITPPVVETKLDYVPMIWGYNDVNNAKINLIKKGFEDGIYTNLLTFNEPDMGGDAGGSKMTVEQALECWPKLQDIGIRISSPAVAGDYEWLEKFMTECKEQGYRVDFLAVHCYQDVTDSSSVTNLRNLLTDLNTKYGLPIWLTEFGCIDVSAWSGGVNEKYTAESSAKYLEKCTSMLEELGFVERYSFFLDNYGGGANPYEGRFSRLYDNNDELNLIGETYTKVESHLPLIIHNINPPDCETGSEYTLKIVSQGGTKPYKFSVTGLPSGLMIDEDTGLISGVYEKGGARMVVVVTDANGQINRAIYDVKDRSKE